MQNDELKALEMMTDIELSSCDVDCGDDVETVDIFDIVDREKWEKLKQLITAKAPTPSVSGEVDAIFKWLLGENGDFPPREDGQGAYWWRIELRKRIAALSSPTPQVQDRFNTGTELNLSAQAEVERATEWMPIETAPKDEAKSFLVFRPKIMPDDYDCIIQVSWFEGNLYPDAYNNNVDYSDRITGATHWMPLPKPPSSVIVEGDND